MKHNNAKITFLYLLSLFTLVFAAIGAGTVLFELIDYYFDVDPSYYMNSLRFGVAALIVATPIYLYVAHLINKSLKKGDLDKDNAFRRWLSYLLMLAAAIIFVVWLVMTINNFLSGELTSKFILKFLVILVITGGVFSYYALDIKIDPGKAAAIKKTYFWASVVVVLAVLIWAFSLMESPATMRMLNQDRDTLNELRSIDNALVEYYQREENLPGSLEIFAETAPPYIVGNGGLKNDQGEYYQYEKLAADKYKLCAEFNFSYEEAMEKSDNPWIGRLSLEPGSSTDWKYQAGEHCFEHQVELIEDGPDSRSKPPMPLID